MNKFNSRMKKLMIALAIFASLQIADAQVKSASAAKSAVEKAVADAGNPKKAAKVATWINVAKAYKDAYDSPMGNAILGQSKQELDLVMSSEKPLSTEEVVVGENPYIKVTYDNKELYYDGAQRLNMIVVTKPVLEGVDPLAKALEAYAKAYEVDVKKSKEKDIAAAIEQISGAYMNDAVAKYNFGDYQASSDLFELAYQASAQLPCKNIDTSALYNVAFTAMMTQNYERAKDALVKCLEYNYYGTGGDVYPRLSECYDKLGDKAKSKETLEQGMIKFPQNQGIVIGLINYYMSTNEDMEKLYSLLAEAKANDPKNASLYYVEGNIRKQAGDKEKAVELYRQSVNANPDAPYDYGYIGEGILYYEEAMEYAEKAQNELDDNKYFALVKEYEASLQKALPPFEQAYNVSKDAGLRVEIAKYLRDINYRFREQDPKYQAAYDRFDAVVKSGQPD